MIALAGNPNCGKTTLFNRLTGEKAHVGNWPGVTVTRKTGVFKGGEMQLIDLPGLYSMTPHSPEEEAAREYLIQGEACRVLNLMDARAIERSLYLTLQLLELDCNVTVAVGMLAEAKREGWQIDCASLARALGISVREAEDTAGLEGAVRCAAPRLTRIRYGVLLESAVSEAVGVLAPCMPSSGKGLRYWAIACLEGIDLTKVGKQRNNKQPIVGAFELCKLDAIRARLEKKAGKEAAAVVAAERYRVIGQILEQAVHKPPHMMYTTRKIDHLALHRFFALPSFAAIMGFMFWLCFGTPGQTLQQCAQALVDQVGAYSGAFLSVLGVSQVVRGLLADGVIGGVGSVLCFLPQLTLLFFGLAFLEECGYLARAAFLMDYPLRTLGLSGKAFMPLIMGFGCTVTAVSAARTLPEKERRLAVLLTPFCSCGAKFPVYALFAGAFFPQGKAMVVASCYAVSVIIGILYARIINKTIYKKYKTAFILELPAYRLPSPLSLLRNTWERCGDFLRKAGSVIFLLSVFVWLMRHIAFAPTPHFVSEEEGFLRIFGTWLVPLFAPLGFDSYEGVVALLAGCAGKEAIVSTLGVLCASGGSMILLGETLKGLFTPLSAVSFLVFCTLYAPCLGALSAMASEIGFRGATKAALIQTTIGYVASFVVYQGGMILMGLFV